MLVTRLLNLLILVAATGLAGYAAYQSKSSSQYWQVSAVLPPFRKPDIKQSVRCTDFARVDVAHLFANLVIRNAIRPF
jgi:hypothetical protein